MVSHVCAFKRFLPKSSNNGHEPTFLSEHAADETKHHQRLDSIFSWESASQIFISPIIVRFGNEKELWHSLALCLQPLRRSPGRRKAKSALPSVHVSLLRPSMACLLRCARPECRSRIPTASARDTVCGARRTPTSQVHNESGSKRVVVTKSLPGERWLQFLLNADCRVEVCKQPDIILNNATIKQLLGTKCDGVIGQLTEVRPEPAYASRAVPPPEWHHGPGALLSN
jgi:hypothetical protein